MSTVQLVLTHVEYSSVSDDPEATWSWFQDAQKNDGVLARSNTLLATRRLLSAHYGERLAQTRPTSTCMLASDMGNFSSNVHRVGTDVRIFGSSVLTLAEAGRPTLRVGAKVIVDSTLRLSRTPAPTWASLWANRLGSDWACFCYTRITTEKIRLLRDAAEAHYGKEPV